ncbi:TPA: hypothetical protein HA334_06015, partial [Candidatus Aciduliprofundum boonei]|nr:hypothetical protein [Candidatus Aciduliprofundum boonei]
MKIKNFRIFRYGPLSDTGEFELKNFNILWGKNEKGKTLIVDALLKIMMERGYNSLFDKINRIEGTPEGYVILEYEGKEYKLPQDGYLTEDISAEDFRNIFVIRDSDLSIKYEDDYYNNLTERLTGSKVDIVGSIQRKLLDVGKITDTGRFSNSQRDHKLKSRIDKADDLLKRINALINDLKENNIEEMEIQLISKKREEREISNHLEKLHLVQKKNKLMAGEQLLNDLTEKLNELKNYEKYKEDDLDAWKKYNDDLSKYNKELQKLVNKHNDIIKDQDNVIAEKKALEEKLNKLKKQKELADTLENYINEVNRIEPDYIECDKKLNELENEVNRASQEKKMADYAWNYITKKNIQKRIEDLKNTSWNLEKSQSIRKVFNYIMIFSFVTGITAIAAGAILGSILSIAGGLAFASIGLLLGYVQYRMVKGEKKEDTWEEIINDITPVLEVKPTKSDIEYQ